MKTNFATTTMIVLLAAFFVAGATGSAFAKEKPTLNGQLKQVLGHYVEIQKLLARDSMQGLPKVASKLSKSADNAAKLAERDKNLKNGKELAGILKNMSKSARKIGTPNIKFLEARGAFKSLSESAITVVKYLPEKERAGYSVFYCPMAEAKWMQADAKMKNPYYGKEMQTCGEKVSHM